MVWSYGISHCNHLHKSAILPRHAHSNVLDVKVEMQWRLCTVFQEWGELNGKFSIFNLLIFACIAWWMRHRFTACRRNLCMLQIPCFSLFTPPGYRGGSKMITDTGIWAAHMSYSISLKPPNQAVLRMIRLDEQIRCHWSRPSKEEQNNAWDVRCLEGCCY